MMTARAATAPWSMIRRTGGRLVVALLLLLGVGYALGKLSQSVAQPADLDLVRDVAAHRVQSLIVLAHDLSWLGQGYVIAPLALVCCAVLYRRGRRSSALAVAASVLGAFAISSFDKLLIDRPRPPVPHLETVSSASFPSGHATEVSAFLLALLIAFLRTAPRRRWLLAASIATVTLITGVALSRVYLGVHYPSDVLGGALIGSSWSVISARLLLARRPR
jgi:membrane-associated phospholipid phosphatase